MSAPSPLTRRRKGRADSPRSSNDTASVPVAPVKAIQTTNGSNGTDGNGVSVTKELSTLNEISKQTVLNTTFDVFMKTELAVEARKFDCVKHVRPAQFPEALGALPFPQELRGLVAWTDAFVERLGWAALQAEQKTASKQTSLTRAEQKIESLNLRIQDLQTKLHDSVGMNHKLKGEISHLTSRNRALEEQHKWDVEQIESFNNTISEKQTMIWGLTKENEKQRASKDVETQVTATKDALAKADIAEARFKNLEAENARLVTLDAQLSERVLSITEQLKRLEAEFGASEGQKATLEALLAELKKKETNAQIEIQNLHQKLHDAKESVEDAKEKVLAANEHARAHWDILQAIRVDGGWSRTDKGDVCDIKLAPSVCRLPESQTQPIAEINNPFNN
ncbi:uncharacterized protein N7506_011806 [Penicillium brevicompactum]|uniref:uncharacterized protein n=1 Tax=Penicillium brevicompactum TaxID=5074 RepID=UPI002541D35F|nr:uncharacterized protein N7506_011806 [Penicillium brevicompactum]KAJ5319102.1 hypothetical protein N7506_011806 [Penicillium brevicompactum]